MVCSSSDDNFGGKLVQTMRLQVSASDQWQAICSAYRERIEDFLKTIWRYRE